MVPAVQTRHLTFTYEGNAAPAIEDIDLTLHPGEMVCLMGPSGAGKSTLCKCLCRTIPAFHRGDLSGTISILGQPMEDNGIDALTGRVGLVTQDFESQLFSTNVAQEAAFGLEQLGVAPGEIAERVGRALASVGLANHQDRDPATLSGGEKQRLAIAATLVLQPDILVFDEPMTDLDPVGKREIRGILDQLRAEGATLLVVDHDIRTALVADRLVALEQGRLVFDEPADRIASRASRLEALAIRPPEIASVAARLGIDPPPASFEEAVQVLRGRPRATVAIPSAPSPSVAKSAIVEVDDASFSYDAESAVFEHVSLRLEAGCFAALVGPNGSGKSTLAKLFNGLHKPTAGQILIDGEDSRALGLAATAARIGYVFQNPDLQIFGETVEGEVRFGPANLGLSEAEIEARVEETLASVGLEGVRNEDPFILSKGERQRIAIASLLALRPDLLILDEPTTGLDFHEERAVMGLLRDLNTSGMGVLVITHTPWIVADYARRVLVMGDGRMRFDGSVRDFLDDEELLQEAQCVAPDSARIGKALDLAGRNIDDIVHELGSGADK